MSPRQSYGNDTRYFSNLKHHCRRQEQYQQKQNKQHQNKQHHTQQEQQEQQQAHETHLNIFMAE